VTGEGRLVLRPPAEGGLSSTLDFTPKDQIDETGLPQPWGGRTPSDGAQTGVSDEDVMAERGDALSGEGDKSENVTSEANFDEKSSLHKLEIPLQLRRILPWIRDLTSGKNNASNPKPQTSNPEAESQISNVQSQGSDLSDRVAGGTTQ
jgi:hypothetical protein